MNLIQKVFTRKSLCRRGASTFTSFLISKSSKLRGTGSTQTSFSVLLKETRGLSSDIPSILILFWTLLKGINILVVKCTGANTNIISVLLKLLSIHPSIWHWWFKRCIHFWKTYTSTMLGGQFTSSELLRPHFFREQYCCESYHYELRWSTSDKCLCFQDWCLLRICSCSPWLVHAKREPSPPESKEYF